MENVVQQTNNYDQFLFMDTNREQARGHIEALKSAFEEIGNLTRVQPILVNEHYQIIDGQHRFTAAKELGEPIFFTIVSGLGVREARSMNILHRNWQTDDFARSYALSGDTNYQRYLVLREDYGFNHTITLQAIHNGDKKGMFKEFRVGDLVIEDEVATRERLDKLSQVREITPLAKIPTLTLALIEAFKVDGYNHKQLLQKLELNKDQLKPYTTKMDNERMLEDIYNYKMRAGGRLRLY